MNRTHKWRYKRVALDAERESFSKQLLDLSEQAMELHSEISRRAFDGMMGDPITQLNKWLGGLE